MDGVGAAPFPLTDLQEAYLVGMSRLVELGGFRPTYYVELDVAGLDPARACRAADLLIAHHDHLRTVILAEGAQRVLPAGEVRPYRPRIVDLTGAGPAAQQEAIARTRERMCEEGVDPTRWPMFEVVMHRLRPHRVRVHLAMSLLLLDGHGIRQIVSEWQLLYADPDAPLATAPLTFADCVLQQRAEQGTDQFAADLEYWRSRLDSLPGPPDLPLARRLDTIDTVRFTRRSHRLGRRQWLRLRAAALPQQVMPGTVLLHLFAETLRAWATGPRFCLTVLHQAWRAERRDTSTVVGQLGGTVPLEIPGDGDFWDRARHTQDQLWRDLKHGSVSAVRVAREQAARTGGTTHAALPYVFTSMVGSPQPPAGASQPPVAAPPACRVVHTSLRTPQVLIDNQVVDTPDGGIECVWDSVDDAFPAGLVDLMFGAYLAMIGELTRAGGAAAPDPVPAAHRNRVAALNRVPPAGPPARLEDGFLRAAAARPGAVALVAAGRVLTYGELEAASRRVAAWLRARGAGPGQVVAVVMGKGWEQVVAALGVVRAGAAYCPVDARLPAARIRELVAGCAARAVLTQPHHAHPPAGLPAAVAVIDGAGAAVRVVDGAGAAGERGREARSAAGGPAELAYVVYTSGSTGRPKGVMVEHRAAWNTVCDINDRIGLGPGDRVFGISSLSFDLSVWDVFGTLAAGAALVLPPDTASPDPAGWLDLARASGVTVWNSVPALAELLAEAAGPGPGPGLPPLRAFLLSGDWIPLPLPGRLRDLWPAARMIGLGGATEAAIWSNSHEIGQLDPRWRSVPYGTPLRGQTMRVLDDRLAVRPPWATGRIYIGGAGLARGYWRDEALTAQRFVRHPRTGERLYWTGDLGRYRPDGVIELLGRADRQVKVQGYRVEPGEVESVLRSHPDVRDCVVVARGAAGRQRSLAALVVPRPGADPRPAAVAGHARGRLPSYLVPAEVRVVPRLPLTANGKVDLDRATQLVTRDRGAPPAGGAGLAGAAPDGDLVRRLARLWAELTERPGAGPDDDFFALGGTSLLALRLANRVRAEVGADLPLGQVFQTPTPRGLARRIGAGAADDGCVLELAPGGGTGLVLFHPVGGSVGGYVDLARAWDGPVRAVQSPGLCAGEVGEPDLPAMAAGYLVRLDRLGPDGRYLLGGWSMGGVLAYEAGRQLAERGHRPRVVMLDSEVPDGAFATGTVARHREYLADLAGTRLPEPVDRALRGAAADGVAEAARSAAVACGLLPADLDLAGYERLVRVHAHNSAALAGYRPAPADLPVLLIVAAAAGRPDPAAAWRRVCPDIEVERWPFDHYSIAAPAQAPAVAARLSAWTTSG